MNLIETELKAQIRDLKKQIEGLTKTRNFYKTKWLNHTLNSQEKTDEKSHTIEQNSLGSTANRLPHNRHW